MKKNLTFVLIICINFCYAQNSAQKFLIGGTAHVGNGEIIENSLIFISKGKIEMIGSLDSINFDTTNTQVFEAYGKHIYPSFILPNTTLGIAEIDAVRATRDEREVGRFNSNVRSQIAFNTESIVLSTVRTNGVLLAQITPRGGLISGTSSIMMLDGNNWKDATYYKDDGIHLYWPEIYHHDRWTHSHDFTSKDQDYQTDNQTKKYENDLFDLHNFFDNAKHYSLLNDKDVDLRYEALKRVFKGNSSLYIHANTVQGIKEGILFAKKYNIHKVIIVGASESWRILDFIKENDVSIILNRIHSLPSSQDDNINQSFITPKLLKDSGILFCLDYHGDMERMGSRNLPFLAGTTINYGLSKEEALQLITLNPAKILGISHRTGSLQVGKDANLFISTGDALDIMTNNIELLFLMGKKVSLQNHQKELYQKYLYK